MADADIRLLIGVARGGADGDSEALIRSEINEIMKNIKAEVKLDTKSFGTQLRKELDAVSKSGKFYVNLSKIKIGAGAIADFRNQLSAVVNTLNLDKGTSITITAEGIGEITTKASAASESMAQLAAQIEVLNKQKSITSKAVFSLGDGETEAEAQAIQKVVQAYEKWVAMVNEANSANFSASDETRAKIEEERNAILLSIDAINQMRESRLAEANAAREEASSSSSNAKEAVMSETQKQDAIRKTINLRSQVSKYLRDYTAAENGKSSEQYAGLKRYDQELDSLIKRLEGGSMSAEQFKNEFSALNSGVSKSVSGIKAVGEATQTTTQRIGKLSEKFATWFSITRVIMAVIRTMKQMVTATIEIDDALTQLKIVTGANDAQMEKFLSNSISLAKELGQSITDVLGSIETFSRLGYNLEDATELAKFAAILSNVASVDTEEATTGMTSIIKGYNMDVENAEHVADVLVQVGQKYAVSASEMMEAYEKSGAALNATNTSFEKSAGLIAAANASVQNASTVGTALKTVSARIRGATSELSELGEDTDGLAEGFSKYADELKALTGFNIMVEGTTDSYKDIYDIFEGIAQVWDKLSDTQQARVSEILGGTRQLQVVSSIIGNWEDAANAYADAMDAAGTATQANDIYMDSITGHIEVFKTTFQEMGQNLINSDFIKGVVDFGTAILNILNSVSKLINVIGGLNSVLMITLGIIATIKADSILSFFSKTATGITNFISGFGKIGKVIQAYNTVQGPFTSGTQRMNAALNAVGISATTAQIAVGALMAVISAAVIIWQKCKQAQEEARKAAIDAADAAIDESNELSDLVNKYLDLSEAVKTDNSAKESLLSTQSELIDKLGIEKDKVQELVKEYGNLSDAIKAASVEKLQEAETNIRGGLNALKEELLDAADPHGPASKSINHIITTWESDAKEINQKGLQALVNAGYISSGSYSSKGMELWLPSDGDYDLSTIDGIINAYTRLQEMLDIVQATAGSDNEVWDALYGEYNRVTGALNNYNNSISELNQNLAEQYMLNGLIGKDIPTTQDEFDKYRENVIDTALASKEFIGSEQDIENAIDATLKKQSQFVGFYKDATNEIATETRKAKDTAETFSSLLSDSVSDGIDAVQSKVESLSGSLEKLSNGTIEVGDVIDLLQEFPELAEYVDLTADNFGNLDVGLKKLIKDSPKDLIKTLQQFKETNDLTDDAAQKIDNLCDVLEDIPTDAIKDISGEFGLVADAISNAKRALDELDEKLSEDDYDSGYDSRVEHLEGFKEVLKNGEFGSKAYRAYKDYYGLSEMSSDEVLKWVKTNEKYLTEGQEGIANFLDTVSRLGKDGGALDGIASYENGIFTYDINRLGEFADALGWSEGMLQDFINKYRMYSEGFLSRDAADNRTEFTNAGLIFESGDSSYANLSKLAEYIGGTTEEAQGLIDAINELNQTEGVGEVIAFDDTALRNFNGWTEDMYYSGDKAVEVLEALKNLGLGSDEYNKLKQDKGAFNDVLSPLLEQIGWTEEEIDELYHKLYDRPWVIDALVTGAADDSLMEIVNQLQEIDVPVNFDVDEGVLTVTQNTIDNLLEAGATAEQVESIISRLAKRDDVVIPAGLKIEETSVDELLGTEDDNVEITVSLSVDNEQVLATVNATCEQVEEILGVGWNTTLNCDSDDADTKIKNTKLLLEGLPEDTPITVSGDTDGVTSELKSVIDYLRRIDNNKNKTITITYKTVGTPPAQNATGTKHAKAGPSLLGDEYSATGKPKPELVISDGYAYLAGMNGPTMGYLNEGDVVYSYKDTKRILGGAIPAFAGGTNSLGGGYKPYVPGTGWTNQSASDTRSIEEKLKKQLDKMSEELDEILRNFEHTIFLLQKNGGKTADIVAAYRKMQEAVHAQAEKYRALGLNDNSKYIQELQKQWWDYQDSIQEAIVADYEKAAKDRENAITLTENWLENAIAKRNVVDVEHYAGDIVAYYKKMQDIIHEQAEYYRSQGYSDTSDEVSKLSDLWWDYADNIKEVKQRVVDNLIDMVTEASDAVDEIQNVFNTLKAAADEYAENGGFISVDSFQDIIALGPEYMQYLRDENGLLKINEENINKVIAAKTEQLALQNAMNYVERLRLALQSESLEDLNQLLYATTESTNSTWGLVYANLALLGLNGEQYDAALHNINAIRAISDAAKAGIGQATDSLSTMQEGLDNIVQYVMDMLKEKIEDQIDALEDMKDAYADIIDLRKEALRSAKEEADYEDDVADKVKQIAKLQERINVLSLDNSRSAKAQRAKLEEEMAELQKELANSQSEHAISAQEEALDKMQDAYEEEKDKEISKLEETISSQQKLYDMAIDYITTKWETNWQSLFEELIAWNYEHGNELESTIVTAWDNATLAVERYGGKVREALGVYGLGNGYGVWGSGADSAGGSSAGGSSGSVGNTTVGGNSAYGNDSTREEQIHAIIRKMYRNSLSWATADDKTRKERDAENLRLGASLSQFGITAIRHDPTGVWYVDNIGGTRLYDKYKEYCYHTGGIVGDMPTVKQNEVLALLEKGEAVLDEKKEQGLYRLVDFATVLSEKLGKAIDSASMSGALVTAQSGLPSLSTSVPDSVISNRNDNIHFGDVYIYGANAETVEKHREINRQFTNEVLKQLNIKR